MIGLQELLNSIPNKYYWYTVYKDKISRSPTKILVKAFEAKSVFGRIDVLINPVVGDGMFWVNLKKLELEPNPTGKIYQSLMTHDNGRI